MIQSWLLLQIDGSLWEPNVDKRHRSWGLTLKSNIPLAALRDEQLLSSKLGADTKVEHPSGCLFLLWCKQKTYYDLLLGHMAHVDDGPTDR